MVAYIRTDQDRSRSECMEHVLSLLGEATDLDYGFLLSGLVDVYAFLEEAYFKAQSMQARARAL